MSSGDCGEAGESTGQGTFGNRGDPDPQGTHPPIGNWAVASILILGFVATYYLHQTLVVRDALLIRAKFDADVELCASLVKREFLSGQEALYSLMAFYASSELVTAREFHAYCGVLIQQKHFVRALQWVPRIPAERRSTHEIMMRDLANPQGLSAAVLPQMAAYEIREHDKDGELGPARPRDEYYPVSFLEPIKGNETRLGLDLGSEPLYREAILAARDSGNPQATRTLSILQDTRGEPSVLIFGPLYEHRAVLDSVEERRRAFLGVLSVTLGIGDALRTIEAHPEPLEMVVRLLDETDASATLEIGSWRFVEHSGLLGKLLPFEGALPSETFWVDHHLPFAGREWRLYLAPTEAHIASQRSWAPVLSLVLGILGTGLLAAYMFLLTQWKIRVRKQVETRTRELVETKRQLELRAAELARSNSDLDEFASIASHDLRAPLRSIANLSEWIEEQLSSSLTGETRHQMELLRSRVRRMERLIDDLLTYSRAGREPYLTQPVDTARLIENVVFLLNPPPSFRIEVQGDMPVVETAKAPLEQVFANLIGNAIKHHDRPSGRIKISVKDLGTLYEFSVSDDGPGIPPRFHERVFKMFQTLQSRDKVEGSGMGLSLVKRLVERQGGTVYLESDEGKGATFRFTWPKTPMDEAPREQ